MDNEYLYFHLLAESESGKTNIYEVRSKHHGTCLATVKWYGPWRQYAMFPEPETIWNIGCLAEISAFVEGLMRDRSRGRTTA